MKDLKDTLLMPKTNFEMRANLVTKESGFLERWNQMNLYQLIMDQNQGHKQFILHDGPPYANGSIHTGHMLNRHLKDFVIRSKSMQGLHTPFIFGWDTHGLPIENQVIKSGVNRKEVSIDVFRRLCEEYAYKQVSNQKEQIKRLGVLGDYDNAYLTLTKDYEADELEVFKKMALKGLIYRGKKPVHWSPSSETALAEAEIEYQDVVSDSIYVSFKVTKGNQAVPTGAYFVIWTTTPWTLPANVAISVHPRFHYGLYQSEKGQLVVLDDLVDSFAKATKLHLTKIKSFKGRELEYIETAHPLFERTSIVILGEHVTAETGTGAVHTAPGHGDEDFIVGQKYHLPVICPVNERGVFTAEAYKYEGLFYETANSVILDDLRATGALLSASKFTHSYPHDWRTNKPLIFRATPQWFASISPIRHDLLKAAKKVKWYPSWGEGRMTNMIKDRADWTISRQRVWGVPIPIIYHEDGTPIIEEAVFDKIIGLVKEHGSNIWFTHGATFFLPEGYTSSHSPNGKYTKEQDIMDVWFDSGTSALHTLKKHGLPFPADLYLEGNDQYRGWFNASLTTTLAATGLSPFKSVITHGFIVDEKGEKMSKSKGNSLEPVKLASEYGVDILRLWSASIDYQEDAPLSKDLLKQNSETYRKIRNTFKFMLGNLPAADAQKEEILKINRNPNAMIDKLIVNKLHDVANNVVKAYNNYDFAEALQLMSNFMTNELSSFYLDLVKDILYCESVNSRRRLSVQQTLNKIILTLLPLLAPLFIFTAEEIYDFTPVLDRKRSVHLLTFPKKKMVKEEDLKTLSDLLSLRSDVNQKIETLRKDGKIGSSQEVKVTLEKTNFLTPLLKKLRNDELSRYFIVSQVNFAKNLKVSKHTGQKCPRCWNYKHHLVKLEQGCVCARCAKVIKEYE